VWIEGKIGVVSSFSVTTKGENNRMGDSSSNCAYMEQQICQETDDDSFWRPADF
jgi:hypothetical protein